MKLIATHNSATGERAMWYSWLLTPFARCQRKTIREQYENGCRMFDLRIRKVFGTWRLAHGLFVIKTPVEKVLRFLNYRDCYVTITYEGGMDNVESFKDYVLSLQEEFTQIKWGTSAVKYGSQSEGMKVVYKSVLPGKSEWPPTQQGFFPLDGTTWHTYIPIPWLWWCLGKGKKETNDDVFTYVDFL